MKVSKDAKVELHEISWRKDKDVYTVWRKGGYTFIELSEISFLAYNLLKQAKSLQEVSEILQKKYEESYDLEDFVSELVQLGFVHSIDGILIPSSPVKGKTFSFIKKRHVSWVYSKPLLIFDLSLILFAAGILTLTPSYLPSYRDYFFSDSYTFVLVFSILTGLALLFLHEFAHLIAGKAVGVDGYFSIGMRLFFPVAETNLTQLWSAPRNKRYIPFLAGMLNDTLLIAIIVTFFWVSDQFFILKSEPLHAFARLIMLLLYYSITWQFLLFIRTDMYYVIANLLGCRNLYGDSWNLVLNALLTPLKRRTEKPQIPLRELRIVRLYAPFMLMATVISISIFALLGLPILVQMFAQAIQMMVLGYPNDSILFVEGFVLSCLLSIQLFGFLFFMTRSIIRLKSSLTRTFE